MRVMQSGLSILALLFLFISLYRFVQGFQNWQEARAIRNHSFEELARLAQKRDLLKGRLEKLQTNELAKERLVRRLGYIKPGETVYKIAKSAVAPPKRDYETRNASMSR